MNNHTLRSRRPGAPALLVALLALFALTACITKDDTLGANLVPEDQQMKAGFTVLQSGKTLSPRKYVETRLYQTDSIVSSNISSGYLGTAYNDTVGLHAAGFLSQFTNYYLVDEDYFGFRPIFDSAQILLSLSGYGRDTVTEQTFEVYEVIDNAYLTEKPLSEGSDTADSIFYGLFDPMHVSYLGGRSVVGDEPLFTFTLGTENGGAGPSSATAVTMLPTQAGKEFIQRLMLQTGEHAGDYSIYDSENLSGWFDIFKGLYIKPVESDEAKMSGSSETKGTVYATDLSASGFAVYGRNRVEEHPELIQDTIGMVYYFYNSDADYGNVSVNTLKHDYDGSRIDIASARAYNPDGTLNTNRPEVSQTYVEGLGGVITEITFTQDFFDSLEELIAAENAASGKTFRTLAFTQVLMEVYFPGGQYNWEDIDVAGGSEPTLRLIELMNTAPGRLGMYTNYWRRLFISDYNYTYENYYSTTLPYGGYINRSHGCYRMDITGHVQQLWNAYLKAKEESADGTVDLEQLALRKVYLGPEATDLFTNAYTVLQGTPADPGEGTAADDEAPIRFAVAYNLVR